MSINRTLKSFESFLQKIEREGERIDKLKCELEDIIAKVDSLKIDDGFENQASAERHLRKVAFEISTVAIQFRDYCIFDLGSAYDDLDELQIKNSRRRSLK